MLWFAGAEGDTQASMELRGVMHLILLEAGECGERLKACQPELNWSRGTFCTLPLSEFLLFLYAGSIASAESTRHEWVESVPTIKNMTEVWGAIIMHMSTCQGATPARYAGGSRRLWP